MDTGRVDYHGDGLVEADVLASPYLQIRAWVDGALAAAAARVDVSEPMALSVATVDADGAPNVRTVLMRFFDDAPRHESSEAYDRRRAAFVAEL